MPIAHEEEQEQEQEEEEEQRVAELQIEIGFYSHTTAGYCHCTAT